MNTTPLTQFEISGLIARSVEASLRMALQHGCTPDQAGDVAKAIGGNAGMALYLEICERGVAAEE